MKKPVTKQAKKKTTAKPQANTGYADEAPHMGELDIQIDELEITTLQECLDEIGMIDQAVDQYKRDITTLYTRRQLWATRLLWHSNQTQERVQALVVEQAKTYRKVQDLINRNETPH